MKHVLLIITLLSCLASQNENFSGTTEQRGEAIGIQTLMIPRVDDVSALSGTNNSTLVSFGASYQVQLFKEMFVKLSGNYVKRTYSDYRVAITSVDDPEGNESGDYRVTQNIKRITVPLAFYHTLKRADRMFIHGGLSLNTSYFQLNESSIGGSLESSTFLFSFRPHINIEYKPFKDISFFTDISYSYDEFSIDMDYTSIYKEESNSNLTSNKQSKLTVHNGSFKYDQSGIYFEFGILFHL